MTDIRIIEIILAGGVSVIAYFLKEVHLDMKNMQKTMTLQERQISVGVQVQKETERRMENVETDVKELLLNK